MLQLKYFHSHVPHIHICISIYCHSHAFILKFAVPSRRVPYIQFISISEAATEADEKRRKLCYKDPSLSASDSTQVWNVVLNQDKPSTQDVHKALMLGEQNSKVASQSPSSTWYLFTTCFNGVVKLSVPGALYPHTQVLFLFLHMRKSLGMWLRELA